MKHDPRLDVFDETAWDESFDLSDFDPPKPSRWRRLLCRLGFHRPMAAGVWWPHETACLHCGKTLLMDTRGEWFEQVSQ